MAKVIKILSVLLGIIAVGLIGVLVYFSATENIPPAPQKTNTSQTEPVPPLFSSEGADPEPSTANPYKQPDITIAKTGNPTIDAQNQQILEDIKAQQEAVEEMTAEIKQETERVKSETKETRERTLISKLAFFAADVGDYAEVDFDAQKREVYILPTGAAAKSFKDYTGKNKEDWDALKQAIVDSMFDMIAYDFQNVVYCVYYPDGGKIYRIYANGEVVYDAKKEE